MTHSTILDAKDARFIAKVNVYGAGIAGLSAAHELMERGFEVRVVECDRGLDADGVDSPAIGGLARSQYVRAVKHLSARWWDAGEEAEWAAKAPGSDVGLPISFDGQSSALSADGADAVRRVAGAIARRFGAVAIELTAHARDAASAEQRVALAHERALAVKRVLAEALPDLKEEHVTIQAPMEALEGSAESRAAAHALDSAVFIRPVEIILPGEHGFHFFPAYYRHLFDTMTRTPVLDEDGRETGRTVYDNLAAAPMQGYAVQFPKDHRYDAQDVEQFQLRMYRYLTTCPRRRAAEFEDVSWWQYLQGWSPITRTCLYVYSPAFARDTQFAGRVLAAFDARWGDARTNGGTYIQLSLNQWNGKPTFNGLLNGGETEAWFKPWRRYLETRGVEFVQARLHRFELVDGELLPFVSLPGGEAPVPDAPADYFISATDVVSAEQLTAQLPPIGVPGSLRGYTTVVPPSPESARTPELPDLQASIVRDPHQSPGLRPWDRLQTLSGIQFFFTNEFKLVDGYMYFADAEWALSSINSQQFWRSRPYLERNGYISQMSVDIGNWMTPSRNPRLAGKTAWDCTERELAEEVWQQITASLLRQSSDLVLPQPVWYNVDDNIEYSVASEGRPVANRAPYLIPIVGDWKNRPLGDPWDPTPQARNLTPPLPALPEGLWQADHGGYLLHWDKLVFAGTYMRTFTRMTTMEAANESARNAVNAIIDHVVSVRYRQPIAAKVMPPSPVDAVGSNFLPQFPRPSPLGDYCQIWNPEENEVASLQGARDYDELRFGLGLPHVMDASGAELATSIRSYQRAIVNGWTQALPASATKAADAPNAQTLLESLQRVREELEREARAAGAI